MSNITVRALNISRETFRNILSIKDVRIYESNKTNFTDKNYVCVIHILYI